MLTKSRKVREGDLVSIRGGKIIKYDRRRKNPSGVYNEDNRLIILGMDGRIQSLDIPAGVMVQGKTKIRIFP